MADQIRATPQTPGLSAIARALRRAQEFTGQYQIDPRIPLLGGTGLDELLALPGAASLMEDVSYNGPRALIRGGNVATGGIGTFRLDPRVSDLAEVGLNVSPLGALAARGAQSGAMAVGRAGERAAERLVPQIMERGGAGSQALLDLSSGSRSQVVKPKGGNWLEGSVERAVEPMKSGTVAGRTPAERIAEHEALLLDPSLNADQLDRVRYHLGVTQSDAAMNRWLETKLGKYVKNEMATPEDPVRALAERGILHVDPEQLNFRPELHGRFMSEGQTAVAQSPAAKSWEGASDLTVGQMPAGQLLQQGYAEQMPWLAKVPPETPVYMPSQSGMADDLGFGHLVDELRNAINPESGLPANLRLKYQDLEKVTVPQAVERVAKINDWRAAQKAEADMARAMNPATQVVKEYPDQGYKWVELRQPEITAENLPPGYEMQTFKNNMGGTYYSLRDINDGGVEIGAGMSPELAIKSAAKKIEDPRLEDALKYEGETMGHCVGGYCPDVVEGRSKIYSLRDDKGRPHVTIEVQPWRSSQGESLEEFEARLRSDPMRSEQAVRDIMSSPQYRDSIVQIKGKGNKAPKEDYLPAVQDFVRSGNFGKVGDLQNTGLVKFGNEYRLPSDFLYRSDEGEWVNLQDAAKQYFPDSPTKQNNFITGAMGEPLSIKLISKEEGLAGGGAVQGYAAGGLVAGANFPTGDFDPARIDAMVSDLYAMNTV